MVALLLLTASVCTLADGHVSQTCIVEIALCMSEETETEKDSLSNHNAKLLKWRKCLNKE